MAGAGFAAGFFGEATNIMRERGKQKREDELIAEERKQKDADWARQTEHELNMVTARYDLETRAAREEKAKKAEVLATQLYAAGVLPEEIAPLMKDPDAGIMQLEYMLQTIQSVKPSKETVRSVMDTLGAENVTPESLTAVDSGLKDGATSSGASLAYDFAAAISPKNQISPEESRFVAEQASTSLRTAALQDKSKFDAIVADPTSDPEEAKAAAEESKKLAVSIAEADKNGNISLLMENYGVKTVYDMLNNKGLDTAAVLNSPDLLRNPAIVDKAFELANSNDMSPYEALDMLQQNLDALKSTQDTAGGTGRNNLGEALADFVIFYDKSFLPPELASYYTSYTSQQQR